MIPGLVTTIIPVYNRAALLHKAVQSVFDQTYRPIEIIIVDDGSTDDTRNAADELADRNPVVVKVLHEENGGPGRAREAGRKSAAGEFIQYLDSDDILLPCKFELQVAGLREHPECGISYGKLRHYQLPDDVPWKQTGERLDHMFPAFLRQRCWSTPAPLYRRTVSDDAGPWTSLRQEEDWEYDCRIAAKGVHLHYCDQFIAAIGSGGKMSLSSRWAVDTAYLKDRVKAHQLIYSHARKAGIAEDCPEMIYFSRELFFLSRRCGAAGLSRESQELFGLSKEASGAQRSKGLDYRIYQLLASIISWTLMGKVAGYVERLRRS